MAAVLTTSMTLRIILSVRGTLNSGGSFALNASSAHTGSTSRTTHVLSTSRSGVPTDLSHNPHHTYTLDQMRSKPEGEWGPDVDAKSVNELSKGGILPPGSDDVAVISPNPANLGVKITIDREVDYDSPYRK